MLYLGFLEMLTITLMTEGATYFSTFTLIINAPICWALRILFIWGGGEEDNKIRIFLSELALPVFLYTLLLLYFNYFLLLTNFIAGLFCFLECTWIYISIICKKILLIKIKMTNKCSCSIFEMKTVLLLLKTIKDYATLH